MIADHLHGNDKVCCLPVSRQKAIHRYLNREAPQGCMGVQNHLALCCKATLPILCTGHVRVRIDKHERERHLLQATHCLTKQPSGVSHLEVLPREFDAEYVRPDTRNLVDLRCASALGCLPHLCCDMHGCAPAFAVPQP